MGTPAAPRIDDRLRSFIAGSSATHSPAEVTRRTGDLAWELGLVRPSYQQVRELIGGRVRITVAPAAAQTTVGRVVLRSVLRGLDIAYEYPAPGLASWYRRYARGP